MSMDEFDGKFDVNCQESSVPVSAQLFVSAVLHGSSSESHNNDYFKQSGLTICQLLAFNTTKRTRKESSSAYHSKSVESLHWLYF